MSYVGEIPVFDDGGEDKFSVSDISNRELLEGILLELRKIVVHLQLVTDEEIKESDV